MLDVEVQIRKDFDWYNRFTCNDGQLISRVRVGKFIEEQLGKERSVYIDVYKLAHGFELWNEWDFSFHHVESPEEVQAIIEEMQDAWIMWAVDFANETHLQTYRCF